MEPLTIALIQSHLEWEAPEANLQHFEKVFSGLNDPTDLVVLPEMFSSGFTMNPESVAEDMNGRTVNWMKVMAKKHEVAIAGSLVIKEQADYRNRFFFVFPDGQFDFYDKRHGFTYAGEHKKYRSGNARVLMSFKGWKIFPQICYDLRFPVFSRNDLDYDLLIYVANWPAKRINAWDALLKARAIENMAYCVGVNRIGKDGNDYEYPGHSAVYDYLGKSLAYSETAEVLYAEISREPMQRTREQLGFLNDRDEFTLDQG